MGVASCLCLAILDARNLIKAQFGVAQREGAQTPALADRHARQAEQDLRLRLDAMIARVDAATQKADARTGEALSVVREFRTTADARLASIQDQVERTTNGIRSDVRPVLENAANIEAHTDKAVVDLHPQVLGLVAAAKVTAGQTAQTMREVERATPALLKDAQGIGASADGIAADVHTVTTDIAKPKSFWGRFKSWLETAGKIGARFL
jgi:uncharacterized protein YoxC